MLPAHDELIGFSLGFKHPVLDVGLHQPGCDAHDLADDASCT